MQQRSMTLKLLQRFGTTQSRRVLLLNNLGISHSSRLSTCISSTTTAQADDKLSKRAPTPFCESASMAADYLSSTFNIKNRVALVTGSTAGLGYAMAHALVRAGAKVVINGRDERRTLDAVEQLQGYLDTKGYQNSHENVIASHGDVSTQAGARVVIERVIGQTAGKLDILVNNAGINLPETTLIDCQADDWDRIQRVNVGSVFHAVQASLPHLRGSDQARIINLGSIGSHVGLPMNTSYAATKGAVLLLTQSLALELAPENITVNCISPGAMQTRMNEKFFESKEAHQNICSLIPMNQLGDPDELSGVVLLLASNAGSYITGQSLIVDGGYTAC